MTFPRPIAAAFACSVLLPSVAQTSDAAAQAAILAGANALRESRSLAPLREDASLGAAARDFARFMAREERYGHDADGRRPSERATAAGYRFCRVAENIAWASGPGSGGQAGGERFLDGWSRSPGHRANLLEGAHVDTGVGVASAGSRVYAVQLFGRPASARVVFEVRNAAITPQRYRLDGRDWTLSPGATRRHERCEAGAIAVGEHRLPVLDAARYVVDLDARGEPTLRRTAR